MMDACPNCPHFGKHGFCSLSAEARTFLDATSVRVDYSRGSILFREGAPGDAVFGICAGRIKLSSTSREGRTMILRIARTGDVLGLSAMLDGSPFEVTAEAMEPCRVRVMTARVVTQLIQQFPEASRGAVASLVQDYRAAFDEARRFALSASPAGRVAQLLLDWSAQDRPGGKEGTVTLPLTHEELACMTATTRETVTRTLGRFRRDKLITLRGVALTVLRPDALEHIAVC